MRFLRTEREQVPAYGGVQVGGILIEILRTEREQVAAYGGVQRDGILIAHIMLGKCNSKMDN